MCLRLLCSLDIPKPSTNDKCVFVVIYSGHKLHFPFIVSTLLAGQVRAEGPAQSCRLGPALAVHQEPPAQCALPLTPHRPAALACFYSLELVMYPYTSYFHASRLPWNTHLRLACVQKGPE